MKKIEIKQLVKKYNDYVVLDHINLEVQSGAIHGLLGPNGAGKSTLIRILNKILYYDAGNIFIDGDTLEHYDLRHIGYLPEERGLYKDCTIEFQLLYFAKLKGLTVQEAQKNMDYWLKRLEIDSWRKKYIYELSKGMQQKVQFICSVIHNPEILFLDEPFSGFDPLNMQLFKEEILALNNQGTTIILSTHNMKSVEELCNEISFIVKSNVILTNSISSIKKAYNLGNQYEVHFRGSKDLLYDALDSSFSILSITEKDDNYFATIGFEEGLSRDLNQQSTLMNLLLDKFEILSFHKMEPSLDDIFIQVSKDKLNYDYEKTILH